MNFSIMKNVEIFLNGQFQTINRRRGRKILNEQTYKNLLNEEEGSIQDIKFFVTK